MKSLRYLLALTAVCLGCRGEEGEAQRDTSATQDTARVKSELSERVGRLRRIYELSIKDASLDEQTCTGEPTATARAAVAEYHFLKRYAQPGFDPLAGEGARYESLTTSSLRIVPSVERVTTKQQAIDGLWNAKKLESEYDYVAVVVPKVRQAPRLDGDKFFAGNYEGTLVFYELETQQRVCQARISAKSSESVSGSQGKVRSDALWDDYLGRVKDALHAGTKRISRWFILDLD